MRRSCLLVLIAVTASAADGDYRPADGFVPDAETAIKIAVAVWEPIYGPAKIANEKPYRATLSEGVWFIAGSFPLGTLGGTAEATIAKSDGRVLRVSHGK